VCLGSEARAANKAARQNYEHQLEVRERKWMNELALTKVERVQYDQTLDATHVGLGNVYAEIQEKYGDMIGQAMQDNENLRKKFFSENVGDKLAAAGRTGRSVNRMRTVELGNYLAQGSRAAYKLTQSTRELSKEGAKAAAQAKHAQMSAFAQNNIIKNPDIAPPPPVLRNVGQAAFMDAISIGTSLAQTATPFILASSKKVKDNIVKIGESIQGYNVYKFSYKGSPRRYVGVIAEEIQQTKPEAVVTMPSGIIGVNYDLIDVNFKEVPA